MKSLLLILFVFTSYFGLCAQSDSSYFKANTLYQEGRYEEAIESYQSIVFAGFESSTLYYNLGNASFRSNKLGKARLYYEKALKLNPSDEDAKINLEYLKSKLADSFDEVPEIFYKKWYKSLVLSQSSNNWAYISMISFILSAMALTFYLLMRNRTVRRLGFYSSILFLVMSILFLFASWKQYVKIKSPEAAIVTELSVNAKSAPRETGVGLFVLHEGAKVWLEDKAGGWQEIRLSDGRTGWVPQESIEVI